MPKTVENELPKYTQENMSLETLQTKSQLHPGFDISGTRQLPAWMQLNNVSFIITTYSSGKIFWIGLTEKQELSVFDRSFNRPMGIARSIDNQTLYVSTLCQIWRFENAQPSEAGYDANYIPQVAYTTGDIDIHDMVVEDSGRLVFINTLFSCLATISEKYSYVPLWKPPFISKLAPEDRCHLNGLALRDGKARYVTMVSQTDIAEGWREHRQSGGIVMDTTSNEILCEGLSMPHSPRWHQDKLWLLESGTGYLGYIDKAGQFERVTFCPGYVRGLSFINDYAIVGTSKGRDGESFQGLVLEQTLADKKITSGCGLHIINIKTGDRIHGLRMSGKLNELYDVVVLPQICRPRAVGIMNQEIYQTLSMPEHNEAVAL